MKLGALKIAALVAQLPMLLAAQSGVSQLAVELYFDAENFASEELDALIEAYAAQPLIWQHCNSTDLQQLPLRQDLKMSLIELHRQFPKLQSWVELQRQGDFSSDELNILQLFISFARPQPRRGEFTNYFTLQPNAGCLDVGKILLRWRQQLAPPVFLGGLIERDACEPNLIDHWNLSGSLDFPRYTCRVIFGAYRLQWGSGLLHAANLLTARTTDVVNNVAARPTRLSGYWGSDENRYLFGAAIQKELRQGQICLFASGHRRDATIKNHMVLNLRTDGLHITASQMAAQDAVQEQLLGLAGQTTGESSSWGWLVEVVSYSLPIAPLGSKRSIGNLSFTHKSQWQEIQWHGEWLLQSSGKFGSIENLIWNGDGLGLVLSARHYAPGLFTPAGASLAKYGSKNEQGLYGGWKVRLQPHCWWSFFVDYYRTLKTASSATAPKVGYDLVSSLESRLRWKGWVQVTYRIYVQAESLGTPPVRRSLWNLRYRQSISTRHSLNVSCALSGSRLDNSALSCYYRNTSSKLGWSLGVTEYYTRTGQVLYLSEPGVPLQYSLTPLSGRGYRYFGVIAYKPRSGLTAACAVQFSSRWAAGSNAPIATFTGNVQVSVGL